jgi:hypothetical protein
LLTRQVTALQVLRNVSAGVFKSARPRENFDFDAGERAIGEVGLAEKIVMVGVEKSGYPYRVRSVIDEKECSVAFIRSPSPELLLRREMTLQGLTV